MATQHTLNLPVIANARLYGSTNWENTGPSGTYTVTMGRQGTGTQHYAFFRFGEIDIPAYANIISAVFTFYVSGGTDNSGRTHTISGVSDNGTLWTESARNGAGRNTTATAGIYVAKKTGNWFNANVKSIAEAWRDGEMDASRGLCITHSGTDSYKIIDGRLRSNAPSLKIVYEIPASVPVPGASQVEIGQDLTTNLVGVETGVEHTIRYKIGETTLAEYDIGTATTHTYTVPITAGQHFPTATTGNLTVEVETFADDVSRGIVTAGVTLTLPSDKAPTCAATLSRVWLESVDASAKIDAYVQLKSGVRVQTTGTANYGAEITSCTVSCESKTYSGLDVTHAVFTTSGTIQVSVYVTDSRGLTSSVHVTNLQVLPWQAPQIQSFTAKRVNESGNPANDGTRVKIFLNATASSLTVGGAEENNILYLVAYRQIVMEGETVNPWTYADEIVLTGITADEAVILTAGGVAIDDFSDLSGYDFLVAVTDIYATSTLATQIPTSKTMIGLNTVTGTVAIGGASTATADDQTFQVYHPVDALAGIRQFDYSLDRVDTKLKWWDGRTIYQKVIPMPGLPGGTTIQIPIGEAAIHRVVSLDGTLDNGAPLPYVHASTLAWQIKMSVGSLNSDPYVEIVTGSSSVPGYGYIIVRYILPDETYWESPVMTANSSNGCVASASTQYSSNFAPHKAFDAGFTTNWASTSEDTARWLQLQMPYALTDITVILHSTSAASGAENTRDGYFAGSNDGTSFTMLGSFSGRPSKVDAGYSIHKLANVSAYSYIRMVDTGTPTTYNAWAAIAEMKVFGRRA